jgi:hypothetical protein
MIFRLVLKECCETQGALPITPTNLPLACFCDNWHIDPHLKIFVWRSVR